jgi:DNA processing protein
VATGAREQARTQTQRSACADCLRRSWLLAELSPILDLNCRADGRLYELLALGDGELIQALGGRRRAELRRRYTSFCEGRLPVAHGAVELCVHDGRYPRELASSGICPMLHVVGGLERLHGLTGRPVVAIVGTRRASDYGRAVAGDLARGLSASGVTVAALQRDGVALAALAGAVEGGGGTLSVAGNSLDIATAAERRSVREQLRHGGCALSELQCGVSGRRWGVVSAERVLAALATVTLVVEAYDNPRELAAARVARSLDRMLAAVPGRVTSQASSGCHALLREGAQLVSGAGDALELLYEADRPPPRQPTGTRGSSPAKDLEPRLRAMLERVGAGADTPGKLAGEHDDLSEVLRALSELELLGLLSRGDGGRYVARASVQSQAVRYV